MKAYMGLTCKSGAYEEVLKKLILGLQIDQQNVFLLFGPIDILVQFTGMKNLDDFVTTWFNKVRMIGAEENLLIKTLTLIVITEGPPLVENPFAFAFLNTQPKSLEDVRRSVLSQRKVLTADTVFGPYDVICSLRAKNHEDLEQTLAKIQGIPGVERSLTSIVSQVKILPDW